MTVCKLMSTVMLMIVAVTFSHTGGKKFYFPYFVGEKPCQPFFYVEMNLRSWQPFCGCFLSSQISKFRT